MQQTCKENLKEVDNFSLSQKKVFSNGGSESHDPFKKNDHDFLNSYSLEKRTKIDIDNFFKKFSRVVLWIFKKQKFDN